MKYTLNKIPIKTTNNFKINDIDIEFDIPSDYAFHNYEIKSNYLDDLKIEITTKNESISSKIGLDLKKYLCLNILVCKNTSIPEPVIINYNFNDDDVLVDEINIEYEESSSADFIIRYNSLDDGNHFHHLFENVKSNSYSKGCITIINTMNNNSINIASFSNDVFDNAFIKHNLIDLSGKIRLYNIYSQVYNNSKNYFNNIYIGNNNDIIDMLYDLKNIGKKSVNDLVVEGSLNGCSLKKFRGIIDFLEGCVDSTGKENENCILLSDTCISKSLPMLLCHEENVVGAHGESTGKVSSDKLFYLMSRGFSEKDACKLIVMGNFLKIVSNIPDKSIQDELIDIINEKI